MKKVPPSVLINHLNSKMDDKAGSITCFFVFFSHGFIDFVPPFPFVLALQEFSFSQVWARSRHPLQCAFLLERYSHLSSQLSCKISVRQVKGEERILQVYTSVLEVRGARVAAASLITLNYS